MQEISSKGTSKTAVVLPKIYTQRASIFFLPKYAL